MSYRFYGVVKTAELFTLLNPINHTSTRTGLRKYNVEPYVVAADACSVVPHFGLGDWTWYVGATGKIELRGSVFGPYLQGDYLFYC